MGKICDKDITDIFDQFSTLGAKYGKISLSDLAKLNEKSWEFIIIAVVVGDGGGGGCEGGGEMKGRRGIIVV